MRRGFTLIELLVVLAILALLAALIFPVFARVRERGRQTQCLSNLHQIGLALEMYQQDFSGLPPDTYTPGPFLNTKTRNSSWMLLQPYARTLAVFYCPSAWDKNGGEYEYTSMASIMQLHGILRPEPTTVLAFCTQHLEHHAARGGVFFSFYDGLYMALRADGSASRILASKVQRWTYYDGQWSRADENSPPPNSRFFNWFRFPDEPWPPTFER